MRLRHRGPLELLGLDGEVVGTREVDWEVELSTDEDGSPFALGGIAYHAGEPGEGS